MCFQFFTAVFPVIESVESSTICGWDKLYSGLLSGLFLTVFHLCWRQISIMCCTSFWGICLTCATCPKLRTVPCRNDHKSTNKHGKLQQPPETLRQYRSCVHASCRNPLITTSKTKVLCTLYMTECSFYVKSWNCQMCWS